MTRNMQLCVVVFVALATAAPVLAQSGGETTFKSRCAMCHGADGLAASPMAKALGVPSVKSDQFKKFTQAELIASTENGKGKMPAYKGKLTDAQIREVVAYIQSLAKK